MKQNKKSFRYDSLQDTRSIIKILKSITEGLESGKLTFSDEEDEIILTPKGLLQLKLKAAQEENRHSFALKVAWQTEVERKSQKKLKIHSK